MALASVAVCCALPISDEKPDASVYASVAVFSTPSTRLGVTTAENVLFFIVMVVPSA